MLRPLSAAPPPAEPSPAEPSPAASAFSPGALAEPLRRGGAPPMPPPTRAPHLRRGGLVAIAALIVFCAMSALAYLMNAN